MHSFADHHQIDISIDYKTAFNMAARPPMMPPVNETEHTVSRVTREGKNVTYKLSVMQQPERARACGAGAKCMSLPL